MTEQERHAQKSAKAKQSMKKQSVVKNLKWLEKIERNDDRKDVLQMWNIRFFGWIPIPDFKLLISCWILLKNSNLLPCHCADVTNLRVSSRCSLTISVRLQQPHTAQQLTILIQNKTLCGALTRWSYTSHTNTHITERKSRIRAQKV